MTTFQAWIPPAGAVVDPPCHRRALVLGMYSDGSHDDEPKPAGDLNWSAEGDGPCVVAYAIVEEYKPAPKVAREWWIVGDCEAWVRKADAKRNAPLGAEVIHVREALEGREVVAWAVVEANGSFVLRRDEAIARDTADLYSGTVVKLTGVMPNE